MSEGESVYAVPLNVRTIAAIHNHLVELGVLVLEECRPLWHDDVGRFGFNEPSMYFVPHSDTEVNLIFNWEDPDKEYGGGGFDWSLPMSLTEWSTDAHGDVVVSFDRLIDRVNKEVACEFERRLAIKEATADNARKREELAERQTLAFLQAKYKQE